VPLSSRKSRMLPANGSITDSRSKVSGIIFSQGKFLAEHFRVEHLIKV
jgi:hypothetical protein